ncbi:tRNA (guanosine(37)-N1)-methyltransferase TrmD [Porphyromonas gingivalis]|uniref:tRNA (guanine-N(1)-)-methyltransferase n=1 Tax=Porphyromonas gingivalis (strain ATCC 33277 / DSM 20709 / CIP 103683 / JCM 12257 / NCTC 11834 / 2561) TaxID=431947 RepID=TRMD_PORG3|nr:tRNA (guanosine(37)-N1)-methyltransferase TrmD [Porphyromonas gingivalis]B2RMA5.1 RecName: Full=tRNA (guanine-N(1)-)-methyltransferase; AltName: Full=M1G-methyltransferase; AltName: Full=tRNA [GM37] methyltransferase [Porphyromonas gingivalis ATCC 33277]AIJ34842.1 tRNA (guanine-N1)-methyltransferase [Porphyromonas gingivalis]ALJ26363.1 tRNA (guanine-N1)-methyltransferase [Porphyromonas gingivalis 381]AUR50181.1 tRNA (guanine-N(1)-)-methyltransferase [Porphyromonas gingivalis ATCC 33277]MDR4
MRIDIITVLPEMIENTLNCSIIGRAQERGLLELKLHQLRDYSTDKWKRVDDYPFGGEPGMVMQVEPIDRIITELKTQREYDEVIFTSPDGERFDQPMANELSLLSNLIILCGHYKGIDYRIREHLITREISIGDYVLTGGELAAAVMTDAIARLIPGVLNDAGSALSDTFQDNLLAPPVYTRPAEYKGWRVPDILLSGHEANIAKWRLEQAVERTKRLRPDLIKD